MRRDGDVSARLDNRFRTSRQHWNNGFEVDSGSARSSICCQEYSSHSGSMMRKMLLECHGDGLSVAAPHISLSQLNTLTRLSSIFSPWIWSGRSRDASCSRMRGLFRAFHGFLFQKRWRTWSVGCHGLNAFNRQDLAPGGGNYSSKEDAVLFATIPGRREPRHLKDWLLIQHFQRWLEQQESFKGCQEVI